MTQAIAHDPIRPVRNPALTPPTKYQPAAKAPESLVLERGKWWRVQADGTLKLVDQA